MVLPKDADEMGRDPASARQDRSTVKVLPYQCFPYGATRLR